MEKWLEGQNTSCWLVLMTSNTSFNCSLAQGNRLSFCFIRFGDSRSQVAH